VSEISLKKIKKKAESYFYRGEYDKAMQNFSLVLMKSPKDKEARIGAILTDMANENEEKAQSIYEYYQIAKEMEQEDADEIIENLINSSDMSLDLLNQMIDIDEEVLNGYEDDNSINYSDFMKHIDKRGNFKIAYEDIMFSTKVLINKKEDFLDFLEKLIDNGYKDEALNYAEVATSIFPKDLKLQKLFEKAKDSDNKL